MIRTLLGAVIVTGCVALSACSEQPDISANPQLANPRPTTGEKVVAPGTESGGFSEKGATGAPPAPKSGTTGN
jgi:hypothetical protein